MNKHATRLLNSVVVVVLMIMAIAPVSAAQATPSPKIDAPSASVAQPPTPAVSGTYDGVSTAVQFDVSPPLRSIRPLSVREEDKDREIPEGLVDVTQSDSPHTPDAALQSAIGPALMPPPVVNFDGPSNLSNVSPPDPVGDVGPNHYVAMSNLSFQIFNKTGTSLYGPAANNTLWSGFGGPCETENAGDPIVLYDQLADRWLLTQFSDSSAPYYNCVALSTSPDPTGTYYRWAFSAPAFPDYPKYGVWPDAYYISTRETDIGAYALNRVQMLAGNPTPQVVSFHVTQNYNAGNGLLPSDVDGSQLPPMGSPNYFVGTMDDGGGLSAPQDALSLWKFHVDWVTPANSTFTLASTMPVAAFDSIFPCSPGSRDCIPQPGTTNKIDILSYRQRPLHRLAYRNYGTHESLVTNQAVEASTGIAGIRWYEIRSPNSTPIVYQQGTYGPGATDGIHRWMGSVAMDHVGNMALGYSASDGTSTYPSVWYTGRLAGDALGTMPQGEGSIINGTGSQTGSQRWGDYTSMNVDPVDDCTFWYVNEYLPTTSSIGWRLRIGSFKFPSCSLGPQGTLTGQVQDASNSNPIVGARVEATLSPTQTSVVYSNAGGNYNLIVPVGTYTLTGAAYGFMPNTIAGISVVSGTTTTQNLALTPAASYVISGFVRDSATNDPLWATVAVIGMPFNPPFSSVQTDPATGFYSLTMSGGQSYTLTASALLHTAASQGVTPVNDTTVNFNLVATTQNGGLVGWVRNYYTNSPIPNATVAVAAAGNPSDQTDANGYFEILSLPPGSYTATATANLYGPVTLSDIEVLTSNVAIRTFLLPTSQLNYAPTQLNKTLTFGEIATDTAGLVISNTGLGALTYELQETAGDFAPLRSLGPEYLVAGSNTSSIRSITQSLTALGYTYQITSESAFNTIPVTDLLPYRAVIYASNSSTGLPKLVSYLDNGGRLLIADNDVGFTNNSSVFYRQYLEAQYGGDNAGDGTIVGEDIMTGLSADITADPFPDYYTITGTNTTRVFVYSTTGSGNNGPAGSRTARNGYQAVYLPFDFYYLGTSTVGEPIETDVLQRALSWLGGVTYDALPWIAETPITGTLAQNNAQSIQLVWNASNPSVAQPGVYTGSLKIVNNDPIAQNTVLPVTMNVQPLATQGKLAGTISSLGYCDANTAPLAGASVVIQNAGGFTQTLTTNAVGQYGWWLDSAGNAYTVTVSHPTHLGNSTVVNVVAGMTTTHDVALRWSQPCVSVTPNHLSVTLAQGLSTTLPMTLGNSGAAALTYRVNERPGGFLPVGRPLAGGNILLMTEGITTTGLQAYRDALTAAGATWTERTTSPFPTAGELAAYDTLIWADQSSLTPGDAQCQIVADWLTSGNKALFATSIDFLWDLQNGTVGAGEHNLYLLFNTTYVGDGAGTGITSLPGVPGDVIGDGLNLTLAGATASNGDYANETIGAPTGFLYGAGGTGSTRSALTHYASPNYKTVWLGVNFHDGLTLQTERNELMRRVLNYLVPSDVTWLSEAPITGTIASATDQLVNVTFDAGAPEITQPGVYTATLSISSNDPVNSQYNLPVTMNVPIQPSLGKLTGVVTTTGYCDVNPAPLTDANIFIQGSGGYTQSLTTGGNGSYQWWLDSVQSPYTVTVSAVNHPTTEAVVTISAGVTTTQDFVLRLQQPCVTIDPTSFNVNLELGTNTTRPLTLTNSGAVPLIYSLLENQPWLSTAPVSGTTVPDGGTSAIAVTFNADIPEITHPGTYTTTLTVQSNDPVNGSYALPVSMVVSLPSTYGVLAGTVTGLQRCDAPGGPLANTQVLVQSAGGLTWTVTSNASGLYDLSLNQGVYTVTVSASGYATSVPTAVSVSAQVTTTQNFSLRLSQPCVSATPADLSATVAVGQMQTRTLTIRNNGALGTGFELREQAGTPGVLHSTSPVPAAVKKADPVIASKADCAAYENYAGREPMGYAQFCRTSAPVSSSSHPVPSAPTDLGYAQDIRNNRFVQFTLNNFPGQTLVASVANTYYGMDFDPNANTLYALNDTTDQLGTINLSNGVFTSLVSCPPGGGAASWSGLSIDPETGVFYGSTTTDLYTIDPTTGASTLLGPFGTTLMIEVAVSPSGEMYGHDIGTDSIYRINKTTGAATLIGLTTYSANFAQGMDFDNDDGTLYIFLYQSGGANVFGTVNLTTGAVTPLAVSSPQGEFEGAIKISAAYDVPWLSENPITGTVSADSTFPVEVTFTALPTMTAGIYTATLRVNSQDSVNSSIAVPVTMTIIAPAQLTVNKVGQGQVNQIPVQPYAVGQVVTLTAVPDPGWAFSGWSGDLTGTTNPAAITLTGINVVTATFVLACVPVAGVDFTYTPPAPKVGQLVTFNGTALTGTAPITYTWNFGDSSAPGSGSPITHLFPLSASAQSYTVTLTAENACGSAPVAKVIQIQPLTVFLPLIMR
ncbi:hypothetical protein TFLX_05779 [Thermoflexales bacterium]|nr:hypothetical protein TFLX_05779 [Thermoflexales bacterium]